MAIVRQTLCTLRFVLIICPLLSSGARRNVTRHEKGSTSCRYMLTSPSGEINSPGYPYFYPNDLHCTWILKRNVSVQFLLQIHSVELEPSKECEFDTLQIFDGAPNTSPLLRYYCYKGSPDYIRSSGQQISIVFRTDGTESGAGFRMTYSTEPVCNKVLKDSSGSFHTPGYPGHYQSNSSCTYRIINSKAQSVRIHFDEFQLEERQFGICHDVLAVFKKNSARFDLVTKLCGNEKPKELCIQSKEVLLKFSSDSSSGFKGFKATYHLSDKRCQ